MECEKCIHFHMCYSVNNYGNEKLCKNAKPYCQYCKWWNTGRCMLVKGCRRTAFDDYCKSGEIKLSFESEDKEC